MVNKDNKIHFLIPNHLVDGIFLCVLCSPSQPPQRGGVKPHPSGGGWEGAIKGTKKGLVL
jgi:hypothetical protein